MTTWIQYLICVSVLLSPLISCSEKSESSSKSHSQTAAQSTIAPEPPREDKGDIHFSDLAHHAGITFRPTSGEKDKIWIPETMGQGVLIFDFDNDGDWDLYFCNGGRLRNKIENEIYSNSLWRNDGDWKFTDVTDQSGLACPQWSCGAYAVDFDADGNKDVYVTQLGKNRLFRNRGQGKFEDVTNRVGGGDERWSTSAAFFDAEGDGDLDLYVCNYAGFDPKSPPNDGQPCEWRKLAVSCGPRGLPRAKDRFYRFEDGKFIDRTDEAGFTLRNRRGKIEGAYSLGVVTSDLDDDGDQDVYVAVDSRPNLLFENDGNGRFKEVAQEWQTARNLDGEDQAGMGVASADLNHDLMPDLFVTNFSHDTNTFYLNANDREIMYFDDRTSQVGLGGEASFPYLSWGIGMEDFNCDGLTDLLVASGHVYPQAAGHVDLGTTYAQPNQLYIADAPLKFRDRAEEAGHAIRRPLVSRGLAVADFDRDGRMDAIVTHDESWPQVLRNECKIVGSWWGLELQETAPGNREAIGARIVFECKSGKKWLREIHGGGSYLSQGSKTVHVAIPSSETMKSIEIRWPDGKKEVRAAPPANHWYRIMKGESKPKQLTK